MKPCRPLVLLACVSVCACAPSGPAGTGLKVLLVGIDGATWRVAAPLADAGELPVVQSLRERGTQGLLRSDRPMKSPALWTTVATGYGRGRHGIDGFTYTVPGRDGQVLVNSTLRKVPALWDLTGPAGLESGIVGWWATWPAEPLAGWMVTDRLTRSRWSEWSDGVPTRWLTYPEELTRSLLVQVRDPGRVTAADVAEIVELEGGERAEFEAAQHPVRAHALSVLKFAWATQRSYEEMAAQLLASEGQPDLTAVFLVATDPISHTFWHHWEPEAFGLEPGPEHARLGAAVPNIYRHNDAYVGRLLELVDEETVVMIVSDHGFHASGRLPQPAGSEELAGAFDESGEALDDDIVAVGQSGAHQRDGILLAAGGPIRTMKVEGATLFDVAPTVAVLLGLPVAEDLPGRVLTEMIDPAFLERHPVRTVPTWEGSVERRIRDLDEASSVDPAAEEMLRSLGYIE